MTTIDPRQAARARLRRAGKPLSHWDVPKACPTGTARTPTGTDGTLGTGGTNGTLGTTAPVRLDTAGAVERTAIVEHDGLVPGEYAEEFARLQQWCPAGVPEARWRLFINDGGVFLDRWSGEARAHGWNSSELFGLDPVAPTARYDRMGLLWLLKGRTVSALNAAEATISGGHVFQRLPIGNSIHVTS